MRSPLLLVVAAAVLIRQPVVGQTVGEDRRTALWRGIKQALSGPKGPEYFEQLKGALLPWLDGTLVSSTPVDRPSEFVVAMPGSEVAEVTLKLKGNLAKPLPRGTPVTFEGLAIEFKPNPFMLTLEVEEVNRATVPLKKSESKAPRKGSK